MIEQKDTTPIPMSPQFASLIERYKTDSRFEGKEEDRISCIQTLTQLNNFFQAVGLSREIKTIFLTGSYSNRKQFPPRLTEVVDERRQKTERHSGKSDLDIVVAFYSPWSMKRFSREHNEHTDLTVYFQEQARKLGYSELADLLSVHHMVAVPIARFTRLDFARRVIACGTLILGKDLLNLGVKRDEGISLKVNMQYPHRRFIEK